MVDYAYYTKDYGGNTVPESSFTKTEHSAVKKLNRFTFDRIGENVTEAIKLCVCEMCDYLYENAEREGISSVNTDGYSVTYKDTIGAGLYVIVQDYLANTGLLSMGVE